MQGGDIARQHDADLVGEDLLALLSTTPQRSPSPSKPRPTSAPLLLHLVAMACSISMSSGFGIVAREGVVEFDIQRDDLAADGFQDARREGTCRAVAAGGDDLEGASDLRRSRQILEVALGEIGHEA
jgi:hypothetical protein